MPKIIDSKEIIINGVNCTVYIFLSKETYGSEIFVGEKFVYSEQDFETAKEALESAEKFLYKYPVRG